MINDDVDDDGMYDGANITLCMLAGKAIVSVCICQAHPSLCFYTMSPEPLLLPFAISTKLSQWLTLIFFTMNPYLFNFFLVIFQSLHYFYYPVQNSVRRFLNWTYKL